MTAVWIESILVRDRNATPVGCGLAFTTRSSGEGITAATAAAAATAAHDDATTAAGDASCRSYGSMR
jgi:hypothetical protein